MRISSQSCPSRSTSVRSHHASRHRSIPRTSTPAPKLRSVASMRRSHSTHNRSFTSLLTHHHQFNPHHDGQQTQPRNNATSPTPLQLSPHTPTVLTSQQLLSSHHDHVVHLPSLFQPHHHGQGLVRGHNHSSPFLLSTQSTRPINYPPRGMTSVPYTIAKRTFLQSFFEKHRKMSWVLHRRKKMEMSADMMSRPTYRPPRTESMDNIMKQIHEITLGDANQHVMTAVEKELNAPIREDIPVDVSKLTLRQRLNVYWLKASDNAVWLFATYVGLYSSIFFTCYAAIKKSDDFRVAATGQIDSSSLHTLHQVIDAYPEASDVILAMGVTNDTTLIRLGLFFLLSRLMFRRKNIVILEPDSYDQIRYLYKIETPPPIELDLKKIDPDLASGLVPHPGVEAPERHDWYGRDRWRDYIPKDRPDLEYALFSWQRVAAVRRRREGQLRRNRPLKRRIHGPRWAKVGFGIFNAR